MKWYCTKLKKTIETSKDAIPDKDLGFVCPCGRWFDGNKTRVSYHRNLGSKDKPNLVLRYRIAIDQNMPSDVDLHFLVKI